MSFKAHISLFFLLSILIGIASANNYIDIYENFNTSFADKLSASCKTRALTDRSIINNGTEIYFTNPEMPFVCVLDAAYGDFNGSYQLFNSYSNLYTFSHSYELIYNIPTGYRLGADSVIRFRQKKLQGGETQRQGVYVMDEIPNIYAIRYADLGGYGYTSPFGAGWQASAESGTACVGTTTENNIIRVTNVTLYWNYTAMMAGNPNCNTTGILNNSFWQRVRQIKFSLDSAAGGTYGYWGDIWIRLENDTNYLPITNISTEKSSYCVNSSQDTIDIPLNVSSFDYEGDTIYYAKKTGDLINYTTKYTFMDIDCGFLSVFFGCDIVDNTNILNYFFYPTTDTCTINNNGNSTQFSYMSKYDTNGNPRQMLYLKPTCTGNDKSIYFKIPKNSRSFTTKTQLYDLDINETFNVTIYDSGLNPLIILGVERNDTGINFYNYNTSKALITSLTNIKDFELSLNGFLNTNLYGIRVYNGSLFNLLMEKDYINGYETDTSHLATTYSITIDDSTDLYLNYIQIGYSVSSPAFTTTKPTNITLSPGVNWIAVYTTDYPHLGDTYRTDYTQVTVNYGQFCPEFSTTEVSENLIEYENIAGLTGIPLLLNQFLWFIQFPYRFAKSFGFDDVLQIAVTIAFIIAMLNLYILSNTRGAGMSFTSIIVIAWGLSIVLNFMKLIYVIVPITLTLFFAFVLYKSAQGGATNGNV